MACVNYNKQFASTTNSFIAVPSPAYYDFVPNFGINNDNINALYVLDGNALQVWSDAYRGGTSALFNGPCIVNDLSGYGGWNNVISSLQTVAAPMSSRLQPNLGWQNNVAQGPFYIYHAGSSMYVCPKENLNLIANYMALKSDIALNYFYLTTNGCLVHGQTGYYLVAENADHGIIQLWNSSVPNTYSSTLGQLVYGSKWRFTNDNKLYNIDTNRYIVSLNGGKLEDNQLVMASANDTSSFDTIIMHNINDFIVGACMGSSDKIPANYLRTFTYYNQFNQLVPWWLNAAECDIEMKRICSNDTNYYSTPTCSCLNGPTSLPVVCYSNNCASLGYKTQPMKQIDDCSYTTINCTQYNTLSNIERSELDNFNVSQCTTINTAAGDTSSDTTTTNDTPPDDTSSDITDTPTTNEPDAGAPSDTSTGNTSTKPTKKVNTAAIIVILIIMFIIIICVIITFIIRRKTQHH